MRRAWEQVNGTFRRNIWKARADGSIEACSYGLDEGDDLLMTNWNGTILGPPHVRIETKLLVYFEATEG